MIRTHLVLALLIFTSSTSFAATSEQHQALFDSCAQIIDRLEKTTPVPQPLETTKFGNRIVPWLGITEEYFEPGTRIDDWIADGLAERLEEAQMFLINVRDAGAKLPSALRRRLVEALTRATSAYFSSKNIPHSVELFTSIIGQKKWRINVAPRYTSDIPIVQLARELADERTLLQFDFGILASGRAAAAFVEGSRNSGPIADNSIARLGNALFTNHQLDDPRLLLPLRMAYLPEAIKASVGVLHELRHWENSMRRIRREPFPFYGVVFFPLGIDAFFPNESKDSVFMKTYRRYFSLEENDTMAEGFFNLFDMLDNPLAIFNREKDDAYLASEHKIEVHGFVLATQLSEAIGEAVLRDIAEPKNAGSSIKFAEKDGMVWARVTSTLIPRSLKTGFVMSIPLVEALPTQSHTEKVEALRAQMEFLLTSLENRKALAEWMQQQERLRNSELFSSGTYKDFLRVFLSALIPPGFSHDPNYRSLTKEDYERAFETRLDLNFR